ncbi:trypsin-like peptidase domain-containing protein [Parasphingorhabdus cellanae]|uniref:Trypsin-like peptidase domain-containing protein n=1 Tax=Parasphingorhabdus cellanae TaxID=2806553 RepID=A0ABX7T537_9SPHN|nr:trypsin-like peptidase domain-containing protein [Parasphingorhabdus cellanae]QTD55604.1 trypsin-like peptidase domain-containing protein [Parasphingorhabdus cellanae]
MNRFLAMFTIALAALFASPAQADPADISAASRSVVRVVLAATDGDKVAFVGHGSGFAVAPDKIVTNAHVVEIARQEKSVVIGIVPSQGGTSYGGKVIAYSSGNDLALIQLQDGGRLPPMTIFGGPVADGADVVAIGYPGSVDRAQGLNLDDLINPMSPVKTRGSVSGGRSTKQFDTILHTAPIASGNSGGPLIDNCGRILGANSFGSLSDGNDAEFGFAVSSREILSFLRKAGVKVGLTATPCRSSADISLQEQRREAAARAKMEALQRAEKAKRQQAETKLRTTISQDIVTERENQMAVAALMLVLSLVAAGGAGYLMLRDQRTPAIGTAGGAALLLVGAILVFLSRPAFSEIDDRVAVAMKEQLPDDNGTNGGQNLATAGKYQCRLNPERSRITVSQTDSLDIDWTEGGCVNERTQYGRDGAKWSRIFVPNEEQTVTISSFDPTRAEFTTERYLLGLAAMTKAREIRKQYGNRACTTDEQALSDIAEMVKAIRTELPMQTNERLVYECEKLSQ